MVCQKSICSLFIVAASALAAGESTMWVEGESTAAGEATAVLAWGAMADGEGSIEIGYSDTLLTVTHLHTLITEVVFRLELGLEYSY